MNYCNCFIENFAEKVIEKLNYKTYILIEKIWKQRSIIHFKITCDKYEFEKKFLNYYESIKDEDLKRQIFLAIYLYMRHTLGVEIGKLDKTNIKIVSRKTILKSLYYFDRFDDIGKLMLYEL